MTGFQYVFIDSCTGRWRCRGLPLSQTLMGSSMCQLASRCRASRALVSRHVPPGARQRMFQADEPYKLLQLLALPLWPESSRKPVCVAVSHPALRSVPGLRIEASQLLFHQLQPGSPLMAVPRHLPCMSVCFHVSVSGQWTCASPPTVACALRDPFWPPLTMTPPTRARQLLLCSWSLWFVSPRVVVEWRQGACAPVWSGFSLSS